MSRDYTTYEACNKIGVGRTAIYQAIVRGRLLSYKRGTTILIDGEELNRWNKVRRKKKTSVTRSKKEK